MTENRSAWLIAFGGMLTLAVAVGVGRFLYTPTLPSMIADLGLSKTQAGWIASANYLGYLVGALAASSPKLHGSRRLWMIGGLFVGGVTTAAIGLVFDLAAFMGFRFIGGIASAFAFVYSSTLVIDQLIRIDRAELSAVHFGGVGLGIALSALIVSGATLFELDWRWQWIGGGISSLLIALLVCQLVPEQSQSTVVHGADKRSAALITLIAAYGLFGFGYIITATFLMTIVRDTVGIHQLEPIIWLVVGLAGFPSVAIWMWVASRIGVLKSFSIACIAEAVGVCACILWSSPISFLITGILLGGTFIALTALGLVGARTFTTGDPRQVVGLMTASFGCGQIVGPTFAGILYDITGTFTSALTTSVLALFVSSIMVLYISKLDS
jgi:predicted MFS family arabinose efflux permease